MSRTDLNVGRDWSSLSARVLRLLQFHCARIGAVGNRFVAFLGIDLHIAALEQQHLVQRPRSAQLCDLCRTR